ncbi:MAG: flippase [Gemmatimonadaceae bacterium]
MTLLQSPEAERESSGRSGATLGAGEAVARLIAFAASLIVARRLGPASYGVIVVASGIMLYLVQLADQGIELVGVPVVSRLGKSVREIASATVTFRVLVALVLAGVVTAVGLWVLPQPDGSVLAAYAPMLVLTGVSTRWILLGTRHTGVIALARIAGEGAGLALIAVAVHTAVDLTMVPVAAVIGLTITTALMLVGTYRAGVPVSFNWNWEVCRPLFERGRPLVAFTMLGLVLFNFDLLLLRYVKGDATAGEYAAAYAFVSFASNLMVAYAHGVMPSLARAASSQEDRDRVYGTALAQVMGLVLPAAVGGMLVAGPLVHLVFGAEFDAGAVALGWLSLSLPFAAMREVAVVAVVAGGGERALVRVNLVTVICNVALNVVLVPAYGLVGAAVATLSTEIVRLALAAREARALAFHLPPLRRFLKPAVATFAMWGALQLTDAAPVWRAIAIGGVTYGVVLAMLGGLRVHRSSLPELTL